MNPYATPITILMQLPLLTLCTDTVSSNHHLDEDITPPLDVTAPIKPASFSSTLPDTASLFSLFKRSFCPLSHTLRRWQLTLDICWRLRVTLVKDIYTTRMENRHLCECQHLQRGLSELDAQQNWDLFHTRGHKPLKEIMKTGLTGKTDISKW